jgi:hypothetical protein
VKVERDPNRRNRLRLRYGKEIIGTLDIAGRGAKLERLQVRDRTESRPGEIKGVVVEVLHPATTTVKLDLRRGALTKIHKQYGIAEVHVNQIEAEPPYGKDELQLWPPLFDLPMIEQRRKPTAKEIAKWDERRRRLDQLRKAHRQLSDSLEFSRGTHEAAIENKKNHPFVSFFADLIGGADLPSRRIWDRAEEYLESADRAIIAGNPDLAEKDLREAEKARAEASARVEEYRSDTLSGAETAVTVLEKTRDVGEAVAGAVPGPIGGGLRGAYEALEGPPESLEELADRLGPPGVSGGTGTGPGAKAKTKPPGGKAKAKPPRASKPKAKSKAPAKRTRERSAGGKSDDKAKAEAEAKAKAEAEAKAKNEERLKRKQAERQRQTLLNDAYKKAEARHGKGYPNVTDAKDRAWLNADQRHKELAYDPDHTGWTDGSVREARSVLQAEANGLVGRVTRNLDRGADFHDASGKPIDHMAPRDRDPAADRASLLEKLDKRSYDVLLDADSISTTAEAKLIRDVRAELRKKGKEAAIERVISSRTGRLKL